MDTSKPIKGIVADVLRDRGVAELWIKLECGGSIRWPLQKGLILFTNVLVFWDYTRNKPRKVIKVSDLEKDHEEEQPEGVDDEKEDVPNLDELESEYGSGLEEVDLIHKTDEYNNNE